MITKAKLCEISQKDRLNSFLLLFFHSESKKMYFFMAPAL